MMHSSTTTNVAAQPTAARAASRTLKGSIRLGMRHEALAVSPSGPQQSTASAIDASQRRTPARVSDVARPAMLLNFSSTPAILLLNGASVKKRARHAPGRQSPGTS
eukprot:879024-Prymnesium_polylepis.1